MVQILKYSQMKDVAEGVQACIDHGGMNLWSALVDVIDEVEGISVEPDCRYTQCDHGTGLAGRGSCAVGNPADRECAEFTTEYSEGAKMSENIVKRTVSKRTLDFLRGQIDWNKEDQGERGEYIKTKYVCNLIDDMEKAMSSNRVRMNWPFAEESVQDGANREMDEEDTKSECDSPDSPTVIDLKDACSGGYRVKIDFIGCQRTGVVTSTARGTFKFMEDGDGCEHSHHFAPVRSVERVDSDVAKERWTSYHDEEGRQIKRCAADRPGEMLGTVAIFAENATRAQVKVAIMAPEMLEMLEKVTKGAAMIQVDNDKSLATIPSGLLLGINELIIKARGG